MHEGKNMGIMTTLKKTYPRKGGGPQGKCVPLFPNPLPGDVDSHVLRTDTARGTMA